MTSKTVAVIHPWMPQYRTPFFERAIAELSAGGVKLDVYYGQTPPEWQSRNDSDAPASMVGLPTRFISLGGRTIVSKDISAVRTRSPYDLVVLEQAVRNIETYRILASRSMCTSFAFWGHGRTYTEQRSRVEDSLKARLTRRADWFFGYTEGGVESMVKSGFPASRTTVVNNSIDTTQLRADLLSASAAELRELKLEQGLRSDNIVLYIGGIDKAKRVDFLIESARMARRSVEDLELVLVGSGDQLEYYREHHGVEPWIKFTGPKFGVEKAKLFAISKVLAVPGRVGLVAVDSLAAALPIVTTDWPYHAPEFEYLRNDYTAMVTPNELAAYSSALIDVLLNSPKLTELRSNCRKESTQFSIEQMSANFCSGVRSVLGR